MNKLATKCKKEGSSIIIAPEGTRRKSETLEKDCFLPFKKGPFHLAADNDIAILPILIVGTYTILPPGGFSPKSGYI